MSEETSSGHTVSFKFGEKFDAPWDVIRGASAEELRDLLVEFAGYDRVSVAEVPMVDLIAMVAITAQASYNAAKGLGAKPVALPPTATKTAAAKPVAAAKPAVKPAVKAAVKPAVKPAETPVAADPATWKEPAPAAASSAFAEARGETAPAKVEEAAPAAPQTEEAPPFETPTFDRGAWLVERLAEAKAKGDIQALYTAHKDSWTLPGVKEAVLAAAARIG